MKFLTASVLAMTVAAGGAMAQDGTMKSAADNSAAMSEMKDDLIRSRDITGGSIYTWDAADDEGWSSAEYDEVGTDWNEIGEIEDLVLDKDGQLVGVVAEVGGFLDIADKHVLIAIKDVRLVPVDDREMVLLTRMNEEEMEQLPSVNEGFWN